MAFTPITTQEDLDRIVKSRVSRVQRDLDEARQDARKWEERAKESLADVQTWRRESDLWEGRAKTNLAVIRAHEKTIAQFIEKLDDLDNTLLDKEPAP